MRTDPQRLDHMRLGLFVAAGKIFSKADQGVGVWVIAVDCQAALAFGDALVGAIRVQAQQPQCDVRVSGFRPQSEGLAEVGLGGAKPLRAIFGIQMYRNGQIDPCAHDQCADIVRIEIEGAGRSGNVLSVAPGLLCLF